MKLQGVYDSGNKTIDRYTVVLFNRGNYEAFGMSYNADQPNGFNQYIGRVGDQVCQCFLDSAQEVNIKELPKGVLTSIINRMQDFDYE